MGQIKILVLTLLIVLLIWFGYGVLSPLIWGDIKSSGEFGDSFGGVNSLFQGLAFIALVYTIVIQIDQIKGQQRNFEKELVERKKVENFEIAKWLYHEIQIVLGDFEFGKKKGAEALSDFVVSVEQNPSQLSGGLYNPFLESIDIFVAQLSVTIRRTKNLEMNDDDKKIILQKLFYLYQRRIQYSFDVFSTIQPNIMSVRYLQNRINAVEIELDKIRIGLNL